MPGRPQGESADLAHTREEALSRFLALGFPTTRDEEWRFTSVAPIAGQRVCAWRTHRRRRVTATSLPCDRTMHSAPSWCSSTAASHRRSRPPTRCLEACAWVAWRISRRAMPRASRRIWHASRSSTAGLSSRSTPHSSLTAPIFMFRHTRSWKSRSTWCLFRRARRTVVRRCRIRACSRYSATTARQPSSRAMPVRKAPSTSRTS